jgi:hypothetical protein
VPSFSYFDTITVGNVEHERDRVLAWLEVLCYLEVPNILRVGVRPSDQSEAVGLAAYILEWNDPEATNPSPDDPRLAKMLDPQRQLSPADDRPLTVLRALARHLRLATQAENLTRRNATRYIHLMRSPISFLRVTQDQLDRALTILFRRVFQEMEEFSTGLP